MEAIKQPMHMPYFSHVLRGINWANVGAMAIMVLYLLAIMYADYLRDIVQTIFLAPN